MCRENVSVLDTAGSPYTLPHLPILMSLSRIVWHFWIHSSVTRTY